MQQVLRLNQSKRHRELQRSKIKELTPQQLFNNFRYHNQPISPHKVLRHQYQHLHNHSFNDLEHLTERKLYPLANLFAYEPLRANQMDEEHRRSRSISEDNQFLRKYDPVSHQRYKEEYYLNLKMKQKMKRDRQKQAKRQIRQNNLEETVSSIQSDQSSLHIPAAKSPLHRKFRAAATAVYFCVAVKRRLRRFISIRREKCYRFGKMYVQEACLSMQTYYYSILEQQITQYILLLEKVHRYPRYNPNEDILRILSFMTSKVNSSAIPKSLLLSLELVGVNYSFYNFSFLFDSVISRMEVSEEWGCLVEVGREESLMIAASLMGIVMLSFNLLYRPWLAEGLFRKIQKREFKIQQKYERVKKVIFAMGSIVYFFCIDNFIFNLQPIERNYRQFTTFLEEKKIQLVKTLPIAPKGQQEEEVEEHLDSEQEQQQQSMPTTESFRPGAIYKDKTGIIADQNRQFYEQMKESYPYEMNLIGDNLSRWITKATLASLQESEKARRERALKFTGRHRKSVNR